MRPPFKKLETRFDTPFSAMLNTGPVNGAAILATSQSAALPYLWGVECECALSGVFFLHPHTGPPITILETAFAIPYSALPTPEN